MRSDLNTSTSPTSSSSSIASGMIGCTTKILGFAISPSFLSCRPEGAPASRVRCRMIHHVKYRRPVVRCPCIAIPHRRAGHDERRCAGSMTSLDRIDRELRQSFQLPGGMPEITLEHDTTAVVIIDMQYLD